MCLAQNTDCTSALSTLQTFGYTLTSRPQILVLMEMLLLNDMMTSFADPDPTNCFHFYTAATPMALSEQLCTGHGGQFLGLVEGH